MKTAVEYIEEKMLYKQLDYQEFSMLIIEAKEMEKQQIMNAFDISKYGDVGTGEDYYNYLINDFSE